MCKHALTWPNNVYSKPLILDPEKEQAEKSETLGPLDAQQAHGEVNHVSFCLVQREKAPDEI